jgi:putative SOS response-associated peptidase YedK
MQRLHERMPVIISPEERDVWLDPEAEAQALVELLRPAPEALLAAHPVSTLVNAPSNDMPECIQAFGGE